MKLKTVNVNTHELQTGDVVMCHGCLFKLTERKEWPTKDDTEYRGVCVAFQTELLEYNEPTPMPRHWAIDWTIQGNKLAMWAKVVE